MGQLDSVPHIEAIPGRGLKGDRYETGIGSYSKSAGGRDVTLIEVEALWRFFGSTGVDLHPSVTRRNLLTEGVSLSSLIGSRFRVGPVELLGLRLCPPCSHLARLSGMPEILKGLAHSGGIYAEILTGGNLAVGDPILPAMECQIADYSRLTI